MQEYFLHRNNHGFFRQEGYFGKEYPARLIFHVHENGYVQHDDDYVDDHSDQCDDAHDHFDESAYGRSHAYAHAYAYGYDHVNELLRYAHAGGYEYEHVDGSRDYSLRAFLW